MGLLENRHKITANAIVRASPYIRPFWEYQKIYPTGTDYNIIFIQNISGKLDIKKLENAFKRMLSEIVVMGCNIQERDNELYWVQRGHAHDFTIKLLNSKKEIKEFCLNPISIENECLIRVGIHIEHNNYYKLIFILHHILLDGSSVISLFNELSNYYNYRDYHYPITIQSQIDNLNNLNKATVKRIGKLKKPHEFWYNLLSNANENIEINHLSSNRHSTSIKESYFELDDNFIKKLNLYMAKNNISQFKLLLSAWYVFLCRYFNSDNIVLHFPIAIQEGAELHYGCSINSVLVALKVGEDDTFFSFCKKLKSYIKEIQSGDYWALPINEVSKKNNIKKLNFSIAKTSFKNESLMLDHLKCSSENFISTDIGSSDLLLLLDFNNSKNMCLKYRVSKVDVDSAIALQNDFVTFLHDLIVLKEEKVLKIKIGSYGFIKEQSYDRVAVERKFIDILKAKMVSYGDNRALIFKDITLTYGQLNNLVNKFSSDLKKSIDQLTLNQSPIIPLFVDRSIDMIVAILGVLKLGYGYLPIEPFIPELRLKYILNEINPSIIITHKKFQNKLFSHNTYVLDLEKIKASNCSNPEAIMSNDITYIMYTSGTTGNPKGIKISNSCALNRIQHMSGITSLGPNDVYLFKTSYSFDVSFSDIFVTLFSGATLVVTEKLFDPKEIISLIEKHKITATHFVPSQYRALKDKISDLRTLKQIFFSGEALLARDLNDVDLKKTRIINFYGPTETGECTYHEVKNKNYIPIGKCIAGFTAMIMDRWGNLSPVGSVGTLFLASSFVSDIYIKKSDSRNKIIMNSHTDISHSKYLYDTGDLVRINKYYDLEYVGRQDSLIKVNGYRVELEEIKSTILKFKGVKDACVEIESAHGLDKIIGYIAAPKDTCLIALREFLLNYIPYYSIPSKFYLVDQFDLNNNGKIKNNYAITEHGYKEKTSLSLASQLEKEICLFCAIKAKKSVFPGYNIFDLGFSSIDVIELVSFVEKKVDYSFPIELIYKYPVISDFSNQIRSYQKNEIISINKEKLDDTAVFFHTTDGGNEVYYQLTELLEARSIGLNSFNLSSSNLITNLDLMCEKYSDSLKESGYLSNIKYLCGWSFGGLLAFKVATILSHQFNIKPLVILIDTVTPNFYCDLLKLIDKSKYPNLLGPDVMPYNLTKKQSALMKKLKSVSVTYKNMIPSCLLEHYYGDVLLIKATQPIKSIYSNQRALNLFENTEDYGWKKYINGEFYIETIEADHQSILTHYSQKIAEIINGFITNHLVAIS